MFGMFTKNCNIGFNADINKEKRHGIAWIESTAGGVTQQSFIADNPQHLVNASSDTIKGIFKQIKKMGMKPVHLELLINEKRVVYKIGKRKPILSQRYN